MRFVPTHCLREGMVLAKGLYGKDESLLLNKGQVIKTSYIKKIHKLGYQGVYITDEYSDDIVIESVISDNLRISAVRAVKDIFILSENKSDNGLDAMMRTMQTVEDLIDEILYNRNIMVNMVDLKSFDEYTFAHSVNVAVLSIIVGVAADMPRSELYKLGLSALLHDIGKVFVNKKIILKHDSLNENEYDAIKDHPRLGFEYLKDHYDIPSKSYLGVLQHHERFDGTGYPMQLTGSNISKIARIISIADVYDALTSERPYREVLLPSDAMEYIMGGSGTMFDPEYVFLFTRKVAAYPLGTFVKLSNNLVGIVCKNYEDCATRPKLRIIAGGNEDMPQYIDLKNDFSAINLTITQIVKM